ncbi:hypothetical protein C4J81_05095 [Deltaproteobacteria bacterium Smac51]|nr:hypothetical protein C4J81_05095 [Deltaproteobacteria bacterium Smac51]
MKIALTSLASYRESCLRIARDNFAGLAISDVAAREEDYNAWPGLENLSPPKELIVLEERVNDALLDKARTAVLDGRIFWEHTAAGEATRLKLGPKYLIHPHQIPYSRDYLAETFIDNPAAVSEGVPPSFLRLTPHHLLPLRLGARHLWQSVFEIRNLAKEAGLDPDEVMARQKVLLIVNEQTCEQICKRILKRNFLGFAPGNFLFLTQATFHGLLPEGGWHFDESAPARLHNHGQMAMQKTMDHQVFHLDDSGQKHFLSRADFFSLLGQTADLVSYNIEDLGYLTGALDFVTIGLALELGAQGYGMTMEIVANNPLNPIKGGLCAYDSGLGRDVVIESFRLRNMSPERITHLNKNFNHYPNPGRIFQKLHEEGLFMPITVKDGALYFQPVQGDMNLLTRTAYITRRVPAPISSWKSPEDTPAALEAMGRQDSQPGFAKFIESAIEG